MRAVGQQVEAIAKELESQLTSRTGNLISSIERMTERSRGERMVDLSLNAIELIDRNLYERTCDVRWWATDSAVVDCTARPEQAQQEYACERLGVILDAYTVYLDLWLCDLHGRVIANGRPQKYQVIGGDVSGESWFQRGKTLASGNDYAVADIAPQPLLGNALTATYAASVRTGGRADG